MPSVVSKKTALITGCSDGGIGAAMAKILRERDYHVFATLRNKSKAGALASLSGKLDILINNAGRDFLMPLLDVNIEEAKRFFDVNFWGALAVTQAFSPMIIKAKGIILNYSSCCMYSTSKAALKQLSNVLRVELEPLGVRVVTAIIGAVHTNIFTNSTSEALQLPANSYYEPIKHFLVDIREGKIHPKEQDVDIAARHLLDDVFRGKDSYIWRGTTSTTCKWLSGWLPLWLLDNLNNGARGVKELSQYYAKNP
ncbi:putative short-chain dehydrogenase/reductase [Xylaria arbuscula]|nr:putative short-chain dehydrogenase/reductase [Xylaria arbuscula]